MIYLKIVLIIIAYCAIGGVVAGILKRVAKQEDRIDSTEIIGIFWPITIPILILLGISDLIQKL